MNQRNNETIEIDIKELFFVLLHKWWLIILIGIIGASITFSYSEFFITPTYTSTSKLYVINRQKENITTWADMESGAYLAKDFMILVKSRPVTEEVIRNLKLSMSDEELASLISVNTPEDTRIMNIKVTYTDPQMAKLLVDEVARISSERLVNIMEITKITIVEAGNLPLSPASPQIAMNTALGGALGVFLTSFLIILFHIVNDTIRTAEEVEKYLGLTTLGMIPKEEGTVEKKHRSKRKKSRKVQ